MNIDPKIKRVIDRERAARKEAERILEEKSLELFHRNKELTKLNESLEKQVNDRVIEINAREKQFATMFESNPLPMMVYSLTSLAILDVNQTAIDKYGFSFEEFCKMAITELHPPRDHKELSKHIDGVRSGFPVKNHWDHYTKRGDLIEVELYASSIKYQNRDARLVLIKDVTAENKARRSLQRSEDKYRNIMENMELGLLEVNLEGIITNAYPKFCELSGYSIDELIGQNAQNLLLPPVHIKSMNDQVEKRDQGQTGVYEVELKRKNGSLLWVIISGAPFYDHTGQVAGSIGIHLDISDRKRIEQDLIDAKGIAEDSVKSKEIFMANMSHEIRTPMNAIIGLTDLLSKTSLDPKQSKYVSSVNKASENLLVIINDILDFSKIDSGNIEFEFLPTKFSEIVSTLKDVLSLKADAKDLNLIFKIDDEVDTYLLDSTRLTQVLLNLIGNAIKFTDKGSVTLELKIIQTFDDKELLHFVVTDTGIGIKKEQLKNVFQSFKQADNSITRRFGGTGLGLPISQGIIRQLGGEIKVDSIYGKGTTFSFELELKTAKIQTEKANVTNDRKNLDGLEVLVVEDHEINLFMATTILEGLGCTVYTAINGEEGVDKALEKNPHIVLMDMRMPVMDGIEASRILRSKNFIKPIIALTANTSEDDRNRCLYAGMDDFLTKPYTEEHIINLITKFMDKLDYKEDDLSLYKVDMTEMNKSFGGNSAFIDKMINLFKSDCDSQITKLNEYRNVNDADGIRGICHKIKPSMGFLTNKETIDFVIGIENNKLDNEVLTNVPKLIKILTKIKYEL